VRAAALLVALALAGCSNGSGPSAPQQDAAAPCTSLPPADPAASLPNDFPKLPAREGSVRVMQLCQGVLEVRYRLSG
jgi:hypothetical protein